MNLSVIIPKKWNPNSKNGFNSWINKINKYVNNKKHGKTK